MRAQETFGGRAHRPWGQTLAAFGLILAILVVTPFLGPILHIGGFVPRILVTVAGGCVACVALTLLFIHIGEAWLTANT